MVPNLKFYCAKHRQTRILKDKIQEFDVYRKNFAKSILYIDLFFKIYLSRKKNRSCACLDARWCTGAGSWSCCVRTGSGSSGGAP